MRMRTSFLMALVLTGTAYGEGSTQPVSTPRPVDFRMLSAGRGVMLVAGSAFIFDLSKGTREVLGPARRLAVDPDNLVVLLEQRAEESETLTIFDVKAHPRSLASVEIQVLVADIGYANYSPYTSFYVAWAAPGPPTEAGQPLWGTYVLLYDPEAEVIVLNVAPLLSGLAPGPFQAGGLVFSPAKPATFIGSTMRSLVAAGAYGTLFKPDDRTAGAHLIVVRGSKVVTAIPRPAPQAARPIAFSQDGKRVMARAPRVVKESDYVIIDVDSGKTAPCEYIRGSGEVLAASGDLQQVVMQEETRVYLVQAKGESREVLKVPVDREAKADWVHGIFYITDGESLWQVTRRAKVTQALIP